MAVTLEGILVSALAYYVEKDHPGWVCVAALDESEDYQIDVTEIWHGEGQFWLVSASGCSCWEGEYEAEGYATLGDLDKSYWTEEREFNASLAAHHALLATAHHWRET